MFLLPQFSLLPFRSTCDDFEKLVDFKKYIEESKIDVKTSEISLRPIFCRFHFD